MIGGSGDARRHLRRPRLSRIREIAHGRGLCASFLYFLWVEFLTGGNASPCAHSGAPYWGTTILCMIPWFFAAGIPCHQIIDLMYWGVMPHHRGRRKWEPVYRLLSSNAPRHAREDIASFCLSIDRGRGEALLLPSFLQVICFNARKRFIRRQRRVTLVDRRAFARSDDLLRHAYICCWGARSATQCNSIYLPELALHRDATFSIFEFSLHRRMARYYLSHESLTPYGADLIGRARVWAYISGKALLVTAETRRRR